MSAGAVAKLMHEADAKIADALPPSGMRRSAPFGLTAPPVLDHEDDDSFEPTVVDLDAMVCLDDADLEVVAPSLPPPLPTRASRPAPRWQPRPAAFPEWLASVAAEPMVSKDRKRAIVIAAGACAASITLLVWWLC
jgi:hypothetical protein